MYYVILLDMKVWPTTPILGWNDSLAFIGIQSFLFILIINLLAGIWGYYGGCVSVGSGSLFSIFLLCRSMDMAYCMAITWSHQQHTFTFHVSKPMMLRHSLINMRFFLKEVVFIGCVSKTFDTIQERENAFIIK